MTPKELAEKLVRDRKYLEHNGGFLTSRMPMLAKAYLESLIRREKLERVAAAAREPAEYTQKDSDLRKALAELDKSE